MVFAIAPYTAYFIAVWIGVFLVWDFGWYLPRASRRMEARRVARLGPREPEDQRRRDRRDRISRIGGITVGAFITLSGLIGLLT